MNIKMNIDRKTAVPLCVGLLGVLCVGGGMWVFTSTPVSDPQAPVRQMPPVSETSAPTPGPQRETVAPESSVFQTSLGFREAARLHPDVDPRITVLHSMFTDADRQAMDAEAKRAYDIVASQAFFDFMAGKPTTEEADRWWAARGFFFDPNRFKAAFRAYFPTGEPEDYEPEMRATYAALFEGLTAENETEMVFAKSAQFIQDPRNQAWIQGYFNRDGVQRAETLTAWTSGIRHALVDGSTLETAKPVVESSDVYEPSMSPDVLPEDPPPANDVPLREVSRAREPHIVTFEEGSENAPPELLTLDGLETYELPELPTNEGFETLLPKHLPLQRFSPQRVNTALQILNTYGPTEGIRRLRNADPDIAEAVARHIGKPQETPK